MCKSAFLHLFSGGKLNSIKINLNWLQVLFITYTVCLDQITTRTTILLILLSLLITSMLSELIYHY